jgi:dienelactone hydrolase
VHIADIEYWHDGLRLMGELAVDDERNGRRPAVLVCHEGNGISDHSKRSARRLAELGYVAFALDYYGDGRMPPPEEVPARFTALASDPLKTRAIAEAGLEVLLAEERSDPSRVAAIGYCFGGTLVLELARTGADVKAVVGFHPGLSTTRPQDSANIAGKVLVCVGADDPLIPSEHRLAFEAEMRAAGVDWRMYLYGGDGLEYHRPSDERSWRAMLDLFDEVLV